MEKKTRSSKKMASQEEAPWGPWVPKAYENPLVRLLPEDFFSKVPKEPGVYRMIDAYGETLYVGKAKCLRDRLRSYRCAKPGSVAGKVLRMLARVREIRWEECPSEMSALLRENQLLRELDPPYNVVNTRYYNYLFVAVRVRGEGAMRELRFRLTKDPVSRGDLVFGCYKRRDRVKAGYSALLRLVWLAQANQPRVNVPAKLARRSPPYLYTMTWPADWCGPLELFLEGRSPRLLARILERLLENAFIPPFMYRSIQNDFEAAREFFETGPRRNRRLSLTHGVRTKNIAQDRIDDLLVLDRARRGLVDSGVSTDSATESDAGSAPSRAPRVASRAARRA